MSVEFLHSQEPKEILPLRFDAITISGNIATGKTTATRELAEFLGIKLFLGGELFRQVQESKGKQVLGYAPRGVEEDVALNRKIAEAIHSTIHMRGKKSIVEAKLAGFIAKKDEVDAKKKGKPYPKVVRILLTASPEERVQRGLTREKEQNSKITAEQLERKQDERSRKDLAAWRKAEPDLIGIDPMDPKAKYEGEEIYDIVINTDNFSQHGTVVEIIKQLEEKKLIEVKEEKRTTDFSSHGTIFPKN